MNALIVGGSSDIGIKLALYLHSIGYNVIVTYYKDKIDNDNFECLKCDITKQADIDNMFKYLTDKYHKIDILINMAACSDDDDFLSLTKERFMNVFNVNVIGIFSVCQAYSKIFNDGLIINVSSTDGIDTYNEYNTIYASSKAALITISKSISLATSNKIICICPNWIDSDSTKKIDKDYLAAELKRIGQSRLISIDEFCFSIGKIINDDIPSGSIERLDVRGDKLCLEKMP